MDDIVQSLRRQLAEAEENLRLIQERKAEYVLGTDVPLQLVKEERRLENRIAGLRVQLAQQSMRPDDLAALQELLDMFAAAQWNAADPRRFQPRIDELQAAIAAWDGRVERQQQRISDGLEEQRQRLAEEGARRREREHLRVVGRRPLDVTDYFKNRQQEQVILGRLLAEPATRLASVIGHGGMGKTALACKVLRDLERHRWPHTDDEVPLDGIVYLSTRTAGVSLERLFLDCAKLLGSELQEQLNAVWTNPQLGTEEKTTRLLEALSGGRYVILLDNIEDLLDDRGQLLDQDLQLFFDRCLATSHGARVLVTSRVVLAFQRKVMRFDRQVKLLEGLPVEDGVALLRELDPNGDYGLRDTPEEQLADAVSVAHGVPRALEVMASILANDPFGSLADVIEQFYEQEDVVQALIEENYKRLDANARRVIEALAVFRRPVPPLAVDYLLEPFAPGLDVPGIIRRLTRTNIVSVDRTAKTVTLHPIDQDCAYSQLPEESEPQASYTRQALERRAADYYAQLRTPPEIWKSIDDLRAQLAEFEHRVRAEDYEDACRVLEPIDSDGLYLWGHYARLVEMREQLVGRLRDASLQAINLNRLGNACRPIGKSKQAIGLFQEALAIARKIDDRQEEREALGNLGSAYHDLGLFEKAIEFDEKALHTAREIGDRRAEGELLGHLGWVHFRLGQFKRVIKLEEKALAIVREVGDPKVEGEICATLGKAYYALGQLEQAISYLEEALDAASKIDNRRVKGDSLASLGSACRAQGQIEQAIDYYEKSLDNARKTGHRRGETSSLGNLGTAYHARGRFDLAIDRFKKALIIARKADDRWGKSYCLLGLGRALLAMGELSEARLSCKDALALEVPETSFQAALALGMVLLHQHDPTAGDTFREAIDRCLVMLEKTAGLFIPQYSLAAALLGKAVCNPYWEDKSERTMLLAPALAEYRKAIEICAAKGVVQDALRDLELIRAAGIDGLEPVFERLEAALKEND